MHAREAPDGYQTFCTRSAHTGQITFPHAVPLFWEWLGPAPTTLVPPTLPEKPRSCEVEVLRSSECPHPAHCYVPSVSLASPAMRRRRRGICAKLRPPISLTSRIYLSGGRFYGNGAPTTLYWFYLQVLKPAG